MHKSQILLYLLIAFLGGVLLASLVHLSEEVVLVVLGVGMFVLAASAYHRTFGSTAKGIAHRKVGFLVGAMLVALAGGSMRYQQFDADHSRLTEFNDRQVGGNNMLVVVRGYVDGDVVHRDNNVQFPFRVKEIFVLNRKLFADERILITSPALQLVYGDFLVIRAAPEAPRSTGEFDYVLYLKKQGIRTVMTTHDVAADPTRVALTTIEHGQRTAYRALAQLKNRFVASLDASVRTPHASYVAGILLGVRQSLPKDLVQAFQSTGTTHILAISGFNIAIIAEAVMWAMLFFMRRRPAFWVTIAILVLFTLLTGASASVVRAAIMGALVLFANGYGRLYDPKIAIVLAAALMVLANPFVLAFDVGFQLSFLAVVGLIYIYPLLQARTKLPKLAGLSELVLMTVAVQITTLPLIVAVFHTVPLLTLPANILILPFVPYTMLFGFVTGIAGMVWLPLGRVIGSISWALAQEQIGVVRWFAAQPFATTTVEIAWWILMTWYIIIGVLAYRFSKKLNLV